MQIHDLSHPLSEGMPVWPGSPGTRVREVSGYGREGYLEREYSFSSHAGTHVDLERHMLEGGRALGEYAPESFVGRGLVVAAVPGGEGQVPAAALAEAVALSGPCDFLLLHTGWSERWGDPSYFEGFPFLGSDAARLLSSMGLKGVGIDSPSVDAPDGEEYPVHRELFGCGMVIFENLTGLLPLLGRSFLFSALPLPFGGAEASPVRAVGIEGVKAAP